MFFPDRLKFEDETSESKGAKIFPRRRIGGERIAGAAMSDEVEIVEPGEPGSGAAPANAVAGASDALSPARETPSEDGAPAGAAGGKKKPAPRRKSKGKKKAAVKRPGPGSRRAKPAVAAAVEAPHEPATSGDEATAWPFVGNDDVAFDSPSLESSSESLSDLASALDLDRDRHLADEVGSDVDALMPGMPSMPGASNAPQPTEDEAAFASFAADLHSSAAADAPLTEAPAVAAGAFARLRPRLASLASIASLRSSLPRAAVLALAAVAAGFGYGAAVELLFGGRDGDLRDETGIVADDVAAQELAPPPEAELAAAAPLAPPPVAEEHAVAGAERPPEAEPFEMPPLGRVDLRRDHVLAIGRERLEQGDIEAARRVAASFLLREDGLAAEDKLLVPQAYALLGDALRVEWERAQAANRSSVAATAEPEEER
jgi:hypothetical protein